MCYGCRLVVAIQVRLARISVAVKILHVYKDYDPPVRGGIERHVSLMCRYQRKWADVEALVCSRSPFTRRVERDGVEVTEVGELGRFQSAPMAPFFPWHLRRKHADVLVIHVPNPTAELSYLLARPEGQLIVRYHSDVVRQATAMKLYRPFSMRFLEHASLVIPTSKPYLNTSSVLQELKAKCRPVPLGIVTEDFQSPDSERVTALRERYGGDFVFFAGRHRYYKGLPYLVEAAKTIGSRVVIAGDGPEREPTMRLARETGVNIAFPGEISQEELVAHLHACAVFAFPSVERSEAFGMSIMEAHCCGKPVVATKLGTGVEFINEHGKTGINVPPRDANALSNAINELLSDPTRRETMGHYARERIEAHFEAEEIAREEFALYEKTLE